MSRYALTLKLIGLALSALMILNFILYFIGRLNSFLFWLLTLIIALIAWFILPRIKISYDNKH